MACDERRPLSRHQRRRILSVSLERRGKMEPQEIVPRDAGQQARNGQKPLAQPASLPLSLESLEPRAKLDRPVSNADTALVGGNAPRQPRQIGGRQVPEPFHPGAVTLFQPLGQPA